MPDGLRSEFPRTSFPPAGSAEPYAGFEGTVGDRIAASESWWPERPDASGRPNVVVVLVDDVGFADVGCFGSEIETPHLDRLAAEGLRLTNFQVAPMCSPTRAALLTGQHTGHRAGVGHVCHSDAGFPGYAMELADDVATLPEILRDHGWATLMSGKWHLSKDSDNAEAGPRHSWPCQKGFDQFYGFLDGFTNFHQPHRLVRDNTTVDVDTYPDDYYLTDDLTEQAIAMVRASKAANPDKPFLLYLAHGAAHAPLHARADKIAKYAERYHEGWDVLRERRLARQKELGILPEHTRLAPRPDQPGWEAPPWDSLSDDERKVFARYMAVYAAMVEHIDDSIGALRAELEAMGEWEDTVLLFTSDNGASREGGVSGTTSYYTHLGGTVDIARDLARFDDIGGPRTMPHYPQGWAMAGNTPFPLYKTTAHAGARQVPTILHFPARWGGHAGQLRHQYGHASDVLPTLLELLEVEAPTHRDGMPLVPIAGASMVPWLDDPDAPSATEEQGRPFESAGNRAFRRGRWEIASFQAPLARFTDQQFELFDLDADPSCSTDVASEHPEVVAELAAAWEEAAWDGQVFPMDAGSGLKYLLRPERNAYLTRPFTVRPGTPTLERWRSMELISFRGLTVTCDVSYRAGDEGHLVAHGDQGGGWSLRVEAGSGGDGAELVFSHNDGHGTLTQARAPMPDACEQVTCEIARPAGGRWDVTLRVDDTPVGKLEGLTPLFPMAPFQGLDVGTNRRSPVDWSLWEQRGTFPWTGDGYRGATFTPHDHPPDAPFHWIEQVREVALAYD